MRLTCPNCGAQYEVPDDVIPEEGRDVQCSACGDTWFQQPDGMVASAPPVEATPPEPEQTETTPEPQSASEAEPDIAFSSQTSPDLDEGAEQPAAAPPAQAAEQGADQEATEPATQELDRDAAEHEAEAPAVEPDRPGTPVQRGLDPALGDILREEAQREASLRAAAQEQGLETQTSLGLDDLPENEETRRSRQAKDRMARIQGQDPRRLAAEASGLKRGVLPDIEEINSTLRTGETPPPVATPDMTPRRRKSGFTRGFALMILLAVVLVMTYSNAPQIAEVVPQADPYLSNYVTWVDDLRLWLDAQVSALQQPQS